MKVLGLDLSTHTGWCLLEKTDGTPNLLQYGELSSPINNFNVNDNPNKQKEYPYNILDAANRMGQYILSVVEENKPDKIIIENTVRGRNRHTQRALEFIHKSVLDKIRHREKDIIYMDPSEWRSILGMILSKEDKINNKEVSKGKKRGKITKKHLSVRWVNLIYGTEFILKENDICDSVMLASAFLSKT